MKSYLDLEVGKQKYRANLFRPISIGIPLRDGKSNPKCFSAPDPNIEPLKAEGFVGSIEEGSPVNFYNIQLNPHGNGTHTECSGHILDNKLQMGGLLDRYFFLAQLVSLEPERHGKDKVVVLTESLEKGLFDGIEALIVRTVPNERTEKIFKDHSGSNPPYFDVKFLSRINQRGIEHFLTDLPSVDKEFDGGELASHKAFWDEALSDRKQATITELIYVPNKVADGLYLLQHQFMNVALDAAPSNPILYQLERAV